MNEDYCLGLYFNYDLSQLILLKRNKEPYVGMYNGVGGKIEHFESAEKAMKRELREELLIKNEDIFRIEYMLAEQYMSSGNSLHVFAIQGKQENLRILERVFEEGELKAFPVCFGSVFDVYNPYLAGDGNLPYFIRYTLETLKGV